MQTSAFENLQKAFDVAETELGVPQLLDPADLSAGAIDERSLATYHYFYLHWLLVLTTIDTYQSSIASMKGSPFQNAGIVNQGDQVSIVLLPQLSLK